MSTKRRRNTAENDNRAARLRQSGLTYAKIAKHMGYANASGAQKAVERAKKRATTDAETVEQLRADEIERLDLLQAGLWSQAVKGDTKAIDRVARISEQRSKLLGLNQLEGLGGESLSERQCLAVLGAVDAITRALDMSDDDRRRALTAAREHVRTVANGKRG